MKHSSKKIIVLSGVSKRLDIFISGEAGISRSQAQKLIVEEKIMVNGKLPKKAGDRVKSGDNIVILSGAKDPSHSKRDSSPASGRTQNDSEKASATLLSAAPRIVAATPDYIVVEKPTGMLTHPTMANEKNTLVNFLVKKYPGIKKVGDFPLLSKEGRGVVAEAKTYRPGIVQRLDKEASGLLVVARNQPMFNHLKEQFKNRTIEKEYLALVHGKVAKDWDEITFPIARSERNDRMAARPLRQQDLSPTLSSVEERVALLPLLHKGGARGGLAVAKDGTDAKEARTEFLVEKRFVNFTLLRVILHTGRMHQIRVHLLAYNHPLVGDHMYFQKKRKKMWDERLGRLFLHSTKLSFVDLKGKKQTFESPLPEALSEFLEQLR